MNAAGLEKLCKGLQGTTADVKWGNDLCYLIGEKMYCVSSLEGLFKVSFKATPEDFSDLIERDGIIPAPYSARYHWVFVENPAALKPREWIHYIEKSYRLVFEKLPRKVKGAIGDPHRGEGAKQKKAIFAAKSMIPIKKRKLLGE